MSDIMVGDSTNLQDSMLYISTILVNGKPPSEEDTPFHPLKIHSRLWLKTYEAFPTGDHEAFAMLVHVVATFAHLDSLDPSVYRPKDSWSREMKSTFAAEVASYQQALQTMRKGFESTVGSYTGRATATTLQTALSQNQLLSSLITIMFSPSEELQGAAQEVAIQAFDIVGRDAAFRAYIENFPLSAFEGIFTFLRSVKQAIGSFFEASSVSRSTVLCLTDILDVLCSRPNGLLLGPYFSRQEDAKIPESMLTFWELMADVSSVIFKQTPRWSQSMDSEQMVVWMRDVLIFSRDMVAEYDTIQASASDTLQTSMEGASPQKARGGASSVERAMMLKMTDVVKDVIRWLKLTDSELLHQSVELLKMILSTFDKAQSNPPEDVLGRLRGYVQKTGGNHNLTRQQLSVIEDAISPWASPLPESAAPPPPPPLRKKPPRQPSPVESSEDDIEYLGSSSKPSIYAISKPTKNVNSVLMKTIDRSNLSKSSTSTSTGTTRPPEKRHSKHKPEPSKATSSSKAMKEMRESHKARQQHMKTLETAAKSAPPVPRPIVEKPKEAPRKPATPPAAVEREDEEESEESESESEDEEADDDDGKGLAAVSSLQQKSPKKPKPPPERRRIVMLDTAIRNPARERFDAKEQARQTQMRLKPDLTPLHRMILSWNFDHAGDEPPLLPNDHPPFLRPVPDSFQTHEDYRAIMEPLLKLETWSQVVKAKEDRPEITMWEVSNKQYVDEWVDLDITVVDPLPRQWYLAETDIILLRQYDGKDKCILAKVQSFKQNPAGVLACIRCWTGAPDPGLAVRTKWKLSKVFR